MRRATWIIAAIPVAVTIVLWLVDRFAALRKNIAYRVHVNAPIAVTPSSAGTRVDVLLGGQKVEEPSLVLLRVRNAGSLDISADDFVRPLAFQFGERQVVTFEIAEADPPPLKDLIESGGPDQSRPTKSGNEVILPRFPLNKHDRFKLLVLLTGRGGEVEGNAYIAHGGFCGTPAGSVRILAGWHSERSSSWWREPPSDG
jgi:phosphate transport system substrate-binding protein